MILCFLVSCAVYCVSELPSAWSVEMYDEGDLLPISALHHLVFCERRCALIQTEQLWRDNTLTINGSHMHGRAHETGPRRELRGDLLITRGTALRSLRLGVSGIVDVVEFHRDDGSADEADGALPRSISMPGLTGLWTPFPIEYKRGKAPPDYSDDVQLCAQAICIEEMLGVAVRQGALFYGAIQRRKEIPFMTDIRHATEEAAARVHELIRSGITPRAQREPKCRGCSMLELCRPDAMAPRRSAGRYLAEALGQVTHRGEP